MNVSRPFIERPVATTLLMVAVLLLGMLGYHLLSVSALPEVDYPTIQVFTQYPGASPEVISSSITAPLERQLGEMPGLKSMNSTSSDGASVVTLQFDLSLSLDVAEQEVQAAINAAGTFLPANLPYPPVYSKVNPADAPVLTLSLTSDVLPLTKVEDLADTRLAQKISQITGVGLVTISGGQRPAVRVEANTSALNNLGLSIDDLRTSLGTANVNQAKGNIDGKFQAYSIGSNDQLQSAEEYRDLVIAYKNGAPIRLSQIATSTQGPENPRQAAWTDSTPSIVLNIQRQPGANVIDVVDRVQQLLPKLRASLPATLKVAVLTDRTQTIRASVTDVQYELGVAVLLVVIVIFLFLRNFPATIIPAVTVPLTLVGTLAVAYGLGFSLNNLTLMALTISTGFVVDDAIVVVENIMRHLEKGESRMQAALAGAREVGFTVMTISVSLVAVFIPLLLMGGIVGRLFREFSISLSVAIVISMVVSLTVTPMLSSVLLRTKEQVGRDSDHPDSRFHRFYDRTLGWVIEHLFLMGLTTLLVIVLACVLYVLVPKGFFPQEDTGRMSGSIIASQSISFGAIQSNFSDINRKVLSNPNVETVGGFVGGGGGIGGAVNSAQLFITLKSLSERKDSADQVMAQVRKTLGDMPGTRLYLQSAQDITVGGRQSGAQYQYTMTADDQSSLDEWVPKVVAVLHTLPQLTDINTDQQDNSLMASVIVNRDAAARLGVSMSAIDQTLSDAFGQRQVSTIYRSANQYHVVMEVAPPYWSDPSALKGIYVPVGTAAAATKGSAAAPNLSATAKQQLVPLSAIANYSVGRTAISISHQGTFPAVTASFNLTPGVSIGQATALVENAVAQLRMPASVVGQFAGTAQVFQSSVANEPLLIVAALLSVYVVLGMLYESLVHPLTILSTLPSAGVGALIALLLTGTELSIIALVGVILLIGIVKKNAIMMIDFAITERRESGLSAKEAIRRACLIRFRPIMMTTLAAILGALPLVLGTGYGSELRRPLGISIIGGLVFSQLLTLYTTPVIYLWLDRASQRLRRKEQ